MDIVGGLYSLAINIMCPMSIDGRCWKIDRRCGKIDGRCGRPLDRSEVDDLDARHCRPRHHDARRATVSCPAFRDLSEVARGEKMLYFGTDPESYVTPSIL